MTDTIKNILFRIVRPRYWLMSNTYSQAWDAFVLRAIADGDICRVCQYTANVGGKRVWVSNFPYAYGEGYGKDTHALRPSCRTIKLLEEALACTVTKED